MIEQLTRSAPPLLGFKLSGKLHSKDYEQFVPLVDAAIAAQGKVRMLVQFEDFHGWDMHAVWDDTKFAARHYSAIERIAMVGDKAWEKWMASVCKPFTKAQVRYFDAPDLEAAWKWLEEKAQ